jgi:hypothetical protein
MHKIEIISERKTLKRLKGGKSHDHVGTFKWIVTVCLHRLIFGLLSRRVSNGRSATSAFVYTSSNIMKVRKVGETKYVENYTMKVLYASEQHAICLWQMKMIYAKHAY